MYHSMSRKAASVTTSGYLQTPLILLVGEHVDPSTWCAFGGSALGWKMNHRRVMRCTFCTWTLKVGTTTVVVVLLLFYRCVSCSHLF